jgi:hypothetical protein
MTPRVHDGRRAANSLARPGASVQNFIENANIAHFQKLLKSELDSTKRDILIRLLAEEEAKHAETIKTARKQL